MKKQFILLLFGAFILFAHGQEIENKESSSQEVIKELSPGQGVQSAESPLTSVEAMIKQVLGEVYTEVGHIPEPQWFEMEPIAEEYVKVLFQARTMNDGEAATKLAQEARQKYEAAIDAKLTTVQKNVWKQKRAEEKIKIEQLTQLMSSVNEEARQALESFQALEDTQAPEGVQISESRQTPKNAEVTKTISNQPGSKSVKFEFK